MTYRDDGKAALSTVLKQQQNISIIEKIIYNNACESETDVEQTYRSNLYQIVGDILNGKKLKEILEEIKSNKLGWDHHSFQEIKNRMDEQNNFIETPFEVEEGVFECKNFDKKTGKVCRSKKVYSYQVQERSCDEPMTTHATCSQCGTKWTYNG